VSPALQELQEGHPGLQQVPVPGHDSQTEGAVAPVQGLSGTGPELPGLAGHAVRIVGVARDKMGGMGGASRKVGEVGIIFV